VIRTALLSYNGCVRGTNTPDCRAYPEKVRQHVESDARSSCAGKPYEDCVALPLWAALRDTTVPPMPVSRAASSMVEAPVTDRAAQEVPRPAARTLPKSDRMGNWLLGIVTPRVD
jgi:hypothetical protein